MTSHSVTQDRRPWLIISKREAEALLAVARDYIEGAPLLDDQDLLRAERIITAQLAYIDRGAGSEETISTTLIREQRTDPNVRGPQQRPREAES